MKVLLHREHRSDLPGRQRHHRVRELHAGPDRRRAHAGSALPALPAADGSLPPARPGAQLNKLAGPVPFTLPPPPVPGAPLANDASAGKVVFTFDDGPDENTLAVIAELNALHLHGVFFMIGDKIAAHQPAVSAEVASGEVIGNHTWNHRSLTGKGTGTRPLTQAQVRAELARPTPRSWPPAHRSRRCGDRLTAAWTASRRRDGPRPRAAHRAGQRRRTSSTPTTGPGCQPAADRRAGSTRASATARSSRSTTG